MLKKNLFCLVMILGLFSIAGVARPLTNEIKDCKTIKAPIYDIENPMIKQLMDSALVVDPYSYLVLSKYENEKLPGYIQLEYSPITNRDMERITGIYTDSILHKSVIIVDLDSTVLSDYGLVKTGRFSDLQISMSSNPKLKINYLGIFIGLKNNPDDDSYSFMIGYNGQEIWKFPTLANKFSFLGPWMAEKVDEAMGSINGVKKAIKRRYTETSARPALALKGDTIDQVFSYTTLHYGEQPIDTLIALPVYKFDDSFYGRFLSRVCDSIAANDRYKELCIYPDTLSQYETLFIYMLPVYAQDIDLDINGIILCNNGEDPVFLIQIPEGTMAKFGIIPTEMKLVTHFKIYETPFIAAEFLPGYFAAISEISKDEAVFGIRFGGYKLFEEEERPFRWVIDEYINQQDNAVQIRNFKNKE